MMLETAHQSPLADHIDVGACSLGSCMISHEDSPNITAWRSEEEEQRTVPMKKSPRQRRLPLASRISSHVRKSSSDLTASFTSTSNTSTDEGVDGKKSLNLNVAVGSGCISPSKVEYEQADVTGLLSLGLGAAELSVPSLKVTRGFDELLVDEDGKDGEPGDTISSLGRAFSAERVGDELAREVGHSANEYLEECFYTEVSILKREKFEAVPEIMKSDFTISRHLGKGSFSDVFEVVCKKPLNIKNQSNARRSRRSTLSSSITLPTLVGEKPSCSEVHVFALKCLRPQIRSDVELFTIGAEDLVHETAILANLNHRHIIRLHGRASGRLTNAFQLNDGYFILLDRLEGTLLDRIDGWNQQQSERGPTFEQMEIVHSIADAMLYLHAKKIVFRDLKPANIGFAKGVLKLFDFGFAIGLPDKDGDLLLERAGTPRYMAPEVHLPSTGYGLPADVYSFGILLWEVCALALPFSHIKSSDEFERAVFLGGERPVVDSNWPTAVKDLMKSCWSIYPSHRPTMVEVKSTVSSAIPSDKKSPFRRQPSNLRRRRASLRSSCVW